uniref:Uncharacterized protein n=1 Tax=Rhizophora mucronata TaxID=61149 RepID=A0A2P2PLY3_RHIMU
MFNQSPPHIRHIASLLHLHCHFL